MASGQVKWFNPTKGYGFIQPSDGGKDVFVHISAVERAGLSTLNEGQRVEYELVSNRGVAILIDQHLHTPDAVYVDFFGRPAAAAPIRAAFSPARPSALTTTIGGGSW